MTSQCVEVCRYIIEGDALFYDARLLYELLSSYYNVTFVGHLYN